MLFVCQHGGPLIWNGRRTYRKRIADRQADGPDGFQVRGINSTASPMASEALFAGRTMRALALANESIAALSCLGRGATSPLSNIPRRYCVRPATGGISCVKIARRSGGKGSLATAMGRARGGKKRRAEIGRAGGGE